jgi:hypothetical protein
MVPPLVESTRFWKTIVVVFVHDSPHPESSEHILASHLRRTRILVSATEKGKIEMH